MQLAVEHRYPPDSYCYSTLKELVLDGSKIKSLTPEDSKFLSAFQSLVSLSCSCVGLTTLEGFPSWPSLRKLELQDNHLTGHSGINLLSVISPNVRVLRLGGNRIKSAEDLIPYLRSLKSLEVLDVDKNPFTDNSIDWRPQFFSELPQLKSVDCIDISGQECNDDDDELDDEEDEEEDEEEEEEEDDETNDEDPLTLKAFYETNFAENEEEEDQDEDFNPVGVDKDDEPFDEDEGLEADEDEENENVDVSLPDDEASTKKRAIPPSSSSSSGVGETKEPVSSKRPRI